MLLVPQKAYHTFQSSNVKVENRPANMMLFTQPVPERKLRQVPQVRRNGRLSPIPEDESFHGFPCEEEQIALPPRPLRGASKRSVSPSTMHHFLINQERELRRIPSLVRSRHLDKLAKNHAQLMAQKQSITHTVSTIDELQDFLRSPRVGENVQRGPSAVVMHDIAMTHYKVNQSNILSHAYTECGVGTAVGADGQQYMCCYFRKAPRGPCV